MEFLEIIMGYDRNECLACYMTGKGNNPVCCPRQQCRGTDGFNCDHYGDNRMCISCLDSFGDHFQGRVLSGIRACVRAVDDHEGSFGDGIDSGICGYCQEEKTFTIACTLCSMCRHEAVAIQAPNGSTVCVPYDAKTIDLCDMEFTEFPQALFQLPFLKVIHLERNHISKIPAQINSLEYLLEIHLVDNPVDTLEGISNYSNLKIYLGQGKLLTFP